PTSIECEKRHHNSMKSRGKQSGATVLVHDLYTRGAPSRQTVRGTRMMFISFSPLADFPCIAPKLGSSMCCAAIITAIVGPFNLLAVERRCDRGMTRVGLWTFFAAAMARQLSRRPRFLLN